MDAKEIAVVSLVLALLIAIFMWKLVFFGQIFLPADIMNVRYPWRSYFNLTTTEPHNPLLSDTVMIYYPTAHFVYSTLGRGIIPLWNPYIFGGFPFAVDSLYWLSSPANVPFLFLPVALAFSYSAALRLFLAGIFMYVLVRKIGSGILGSLVGAIVFMFNGNTVTWLSFPFHLSSELWIPLIFLLLVKTLSQRKIGYAILTGGILGLHFLAGFLQMSLYLLLAMVAYLLWVVAIEYRRSRSPGGAARQVSLFFVALLVGLLIGAVSILPLREYIDLSIRAVECGAGCPGRGYPLPYVFTFLVPNLFGNPADHNFWGPWGNYTECVKYVGILPLVLAAIALLFRKNQRERRIYCDFFFCLASLSILVAMGSSSPLYPVLSLVPYFYTASPIRALSLLTFSVSVLSGLGADLLDRDMANALREKLSKVLKTLLCVSPYILILLALLAFARSLGPLCSVLSDRGIYQSLIDYEITNLLQFVVWTVSGVGLLALFARKALRRKVFCLLLVLLIAANLFVAGINYNTFADPATVFPATESTSFLMADQGLYRILPVGGFQTLIPNSPAVYGISTVGGYNPLCTQRYSEYVSLIDGAVITSNGALAFTSFTESRLVDLLNVKYEVAPPNFPDPTITNLKLVYDGEVRIYENLAYLPRAFVVHELKVITDRSAILKELRSEAFDPTRYVILEENVPNEMQSGQAPSRESSPAEVASYSPDKVVVNTKMSTNGFLVLADAYDSNWEVYVDGSPGRIHVADYVFRAVYLDKGDHRVEFVYNPHAFKSLLYVSLLTILGVAVVTTLTIYRSRLGKLQGTHLGASGAESR